MYGMNVTRHLTIHGRVQGVWYRGWTVRTARKLGLAGWVRNRTDGSVEAIVEGDEERVREFIRLAMKGPESARVERIDERDSARLGATGFEQHPTA
jgi:acylphosphatase